MIQLVRQMIFPILIIFFTNLKDQRAWLVIAGTLLLMALLLGLAFLSWKNTLYYVENGTLFYEKGILNKSKQGISIDKITTINENQELIERIFQLTTFKVDAGSTTKGNEIKLTISQKEASRLKALLNSRETRDNHLNSMNDNAQSAASKLKENSKTIHVQVNDLILYAVTSNSVFAGLFFVLATFQFAQEMPVVKQLMEGPGMERINQYLDANVKDMAVTQIIVVVVVLVLIYMFFSFAVSVVLAVIKYYGFTVRRLDDRLEISYGLIERKSYNLSVDKITALYINYGMIGQFMKIGAIKIESIGYGDEKGEAAILYPMLRAGRRAEIIHQLLPEYSFEDPVCRPPQRALKSFLIKNTAWMFPIAAIASFTVPYGPVVWILVPILGFIGYMSYKKTRISRAHGQFVLSGGVMGRWIAVIKEKHVQAVITKQSWFQKRIGLMHLEYSYQSNNFGKKLGVQFIDQADGADFDSI